jgi:hypothetical protein
MGLINQSGLFSGAGLVDKAGLYNEAGLYVPGLFSPLSLNPLLAYEAESSMVAPFEQPTLDLDPSDPSSLDIITATRAGVATYTDADGVIQSASADTVRVDHVDGVPMILVEPSATNNVLNKTWYLAGGSSVVGGIDAPDNSTDAYRISNIQSATGDRGYCEPAPIAGGVEYTGSCYVRGTAGETIIVTAKRFSGGTFTAADDQFITLTGEWQRVEGLTWTTAAGNISATIVIYNAGASTTADTLDVWGAQLETGSVATSYIPTSGSTVTRQADDLVISGSDFDFYNQSEGTFYAESIESQNSVDSFVLDANNGFANYIEIFNTGSDTKVVLKSGGTPYVNKVIGNRPSTGVLSRVALSYETNNVSASIDGINMSPDTSATMSTVINKLIIGADFNFANQLNGHIKRLIYWPYHSDSL